MAKVRMRKEEILEESSPDEMDALVFGEEERPKKSWNNPSSVSRKQ